MREREAEQDRLRDEAAEGGLLADEPPPPAKTGASWATFLWYVVLSVLIATANGTATAALNYVNMQLKVLFKSSKIITTMLLGRRWKCGTTR